MFNYSNPCLIEMAERNLIYQGTNNQALDAYLNANKNASAYIGFDATANSLHVGNLTQIMKLRLWQRMGYKPIVLVGGGTTKVGDPSGKNSGRKIIDSSTIEKNIAGQIKILKKYLSFGNKENDAILINNDDWLKNLNFIEILREVGPSFSINKMITFDIIRNRLEQQNNISLPEFCYIILQSYDFYHLNKNFGCCVQMGGADQWANIVSGVDLIRRLNNVEVFGLTNPLLTKADGEKMGKTANGAVSLSEDLLPPFDYWQFWRNCDDGDVKNLLLIFTDLTIEEIENLPFEKDINACKIILANESTKITHGKEESIKAQKAAKAFSQGLISNDIPCVNAEDVADLRAVNLLVVAGLCNSKGEAKRLIKGKGAKLNNKNIESVEYVIQEKDLNNEKEIILSFGKKRHVLLRLKS